MTLTDAGLLIALLDRDEADHARGAENDEDLYSRPRLSGLPAARPSSICHRSLVRYLWMPSQFRNRDLFGGQSTARALRVRATTFTERGSSGSSRGAGLLSRGVSSGDSRYHVLIRTDQGDVSSLFGKQYLVQALPHSEPFNFTGKSEDISEKWHGVGVRQIPQNLRDVPAPS